jgi:hypothetical protein
MFDGLSEAEPTERASIEAAISSFATAYPANQVIVSTRRIETPLQSLFASWTLLPPTEEDVHAVFRRRFGERADSMLQQVSEKLPMSPLLLNLITSGLDPTRTGERGLSLQNTIDRLLERISVGSRGLSPDVARLLLRRMVSPIATKVVVTEQEMLAIGRDSGLTDVQTIEYLSALLNTGIITREGFYYSIAHDVIADYFRGGS